MRKAPTLLAARVHPWQLFRIRKVAEWLKQPFSRVIMDALQVYCHGLEIPRETLDKWLDEYHKEFPDVD